MKHSLYTLFSLTLYLYDLRGRFGHFKLFQVCSNTTAANVVAQFSSKTNSSRFKGDRTEETHKLRFLLVSAAMRLLQGNILNSGS